MVREESVHPKLRVRVKSAQPFDDHVTTQLVGVTVRGGVEMTSLPMPTQVPELPAHPHRVPEGIDVLMIERSEQLTAPGSMTRFRPYMTPRSSLPTLVPSNLAVATHAVSNSAAFSSDRGTL